MWKKRTLRKSMQEKYVNNRTVKKLTEEEIDDRFYRKIT